MTKYFYMPSVNVMGADSVKEVPSFIGENKFKKALIVTDSVLLEIGLVGKVTSILEENNIDYVIYSETKPNPTVKNVNDGLAMLKDNDCDCVISLGGGSPHDCAKGIALLATNGGDIKDYEGVNKSSHPQLPLIAINTTAGTASEMTIFSIITDEDRHVKMALVDKHMTPVLAVNDPMLMVAMPASLTAATGMDALTHAIEAYVSTNATPITDACAEKAIELITYNLKRAVDNGNDLEARDMMSYAEFLAGMAFNNASLGYVHAIAHQLGGVYDLPHGVCNALLLPYVQEFNMNYCADRLRKVASIMGVDVTNLTDIEGAMACIVVIKTLAKSIGIPASLESLGVKREDFDLLATNALKDACGLTNPVQATHADIVGILEKAF